MVWAVLHHTHSSATSFPARAEPSTILPASWLPLRGLPTEDGRQGEGRGHISLVSGAASRRGGCRKGNSGWQIWTPGFPPRHLGARRGKTQKHKDACAFSSSSFSQELIFR